jgi:hypothetical protein
VRRHVKCVSVCLWLMGAFSLQAATGLISSVYDFYGPVRANVEVTDEADPSQRLAGGVDSEGIFRFPDIPPGEYSIKVSARGVHDVTLHAVSIVQGVLKDVGPIHINASCEDSPKTFCFRISGPMLMTGRELELFGPCAFVDLSDPEPSCMVALGLRGPVLRQDDPQEVRFGFQTGGDGVYLIPLGVAFSLNPSTTTDKHGCVNATYALGGIRIDSLPPESRACVRTRWGRYAELIFREVIKPGQEKVTVEYFFLGSSDRPTP